MRIAIADDDDDMRARTLAALSMTGYQCQSFRNGRDLVARLKRETFDLLLLDWNMPGMTAIDVLDWIKQSQSAKPGVIVFTSRSSDNEIAFALDSGADDLIVKPASDEVIRARVDAVLRRKTVEKAETRVELRGEYAFDRLQGSVKFRDTEVRLSPREFALALLFFDNMQRPLSRGYILQRLWNNAQDVTTRTIDVHVSKIRSKLALRPEHGYRLQTVSGYGYRLESYGKPSAVPVPVADVIEPAAAKARLRAVVADDHPMCSAAARMAILAAVPDAEVQVAATLGEAISLSADADIVLLDLALPDSKGVGGIVDVARARPEAPILVVTGSEAPGIERQAMESGAAGFVGKSAPISDLIAALRAVVEGETWFSGAVDRIAAAPTGIAGRVASLTPAESRVLKAMRDGALNKQIAFELGLSEITIKQHVKAILRKLGVVNRTQAVLAVRSLDAIEADVAA